MFRKIQGFVFEKILKYSRRIIFRRIFSREYSQLTSLITTQQATTRPTLSFSFATATQPASLRKDISWCTRVSWVCIKPVSVFLCSRDVPWGGHSRPEAILRTKFSDLFPYFSSTLPYLSVLPSLTLAIHSLCDNL